jgi:hypothetical protein
MKNKSLYIIFLFSFIIPLLHGNLLAQKEITLKGKIFSSITKRPVESGIILVGETKKKYSVNPDGSYEINFPKPGTYTIAVRSAGLKFMKAKINISKDSIRNFWMAAGKLKGDGITITGDNNIQKISRKTMNVEEIKKVPASFGDSINALTSLPGVIKAGGGFFGAFWGSFFGSLVIRGMYSDRNRYYIDGLPINNPLHFGGLHSVIATDLVASIDMYSSAFPVRYGGPIAGVIDIHTVDKEVKQFGGNIDLSALSASILLTMPVTSTKLIDGKEEIKNAGYLTFAGRYGYLAFFVPVFYKIAFNRDLFVSPEYWDYQFKFKYNFGGGHSLKLLFIGARDFLNFQTSTWMVRPSIGHDPLLQGIQFQLDQMFHNQGLYYTYQTGKIKNELMFFSSLNMNNSYISSTNNEVPPWLSNYNILSYPNIFSLKDSFKWEWLEKKAELRVGLETSVYAFTATGNVNVAFNVMKVLSAIVVSANGPNGFPDLGNPNALQLVPINLNTANFLLGGYVDNVFTFGGLTIVPGFRFDYLTTTNSAVIDPRFMISYEFKSATTVSISGGRYSTFYQLNPSAFNNNPFISSQSYILPESSWQSSLGINQKIGSFKIIAEGYFNYFYNLFQEYPHYENGQLILGQSTGEFLAYGAEFSFEGGYKFDENEMFGSIGYSFTQAKLKSNVTGYKWKTDGSGYENDPSLLPSLVPIRYDQAGDKWISADVEMEHSLKILLGYKRSGHTISARFQLYTSLPYTPVVNGYLSPNPPVGVLRYAPVYSSNVNSAHFPVDHRLDLRYSYQTGYKWGNVSWYLEIINVYGYWNKPLDRQKWFFNNPYLAGVNPQLKGDRDITIIPNFGVEVKW